jgi:molecular chaperone DnaJ
VTQTKKQIRSIRSQAFDGSGGGGGGGGHAGMNMDDIFSQFGDIFGSAFGWWRIGGGGGGQRRTKGSNLRIKVKLTKKLLMVLRKSKSKTKSSSAGVSYKTCSTVMGKDK